MTTNPAKTVVLGLLVLVVFAQAPGLGLLLGLGLLVGRAMLRPREGPTTHGSARLGDLEDAKAGGLLSEHPESVVLGRATWLGQGASPDQLLRLHEFTHLMTCAGTGRGKGVSVVIPNAFLWPKSLIVTDKDFEVFTTVSAYRRRAYGQEQYRIDPMRRLGSGGAGFNPMAEIDGNAITLFIDAWALASLIVFRTGKEHETYWNDQAEAMIAAFIAYVCACEPDPKRRNLLTVRDLLSSPERFQAALAAMKRVTTHHGILARAAGKMEFLKDRELNSVMSSVNRHMNFLGDPGVAEVLSMSSFRASELRTPTGASVFLPIVPGRTDVLSPFNRVMVGSLIRAAADALPFEHNKVLAILDEAGQLGRLPVLEEATTLFRGRGIRLWFIFQSLNQVHTIYDDHAQTLLDNLDTQQYFGLDTATETAEKLSKRIGEATVADSSTNENRSVSRSAPSFGSESGGSVSVSDGAGVNRNWIARRVLFADEIARLPPKIGLLWHRHLPVLPVELVRYYEDPEFAACRAVAAASETRPDRKRGKRRRSRRRLPAGVAHFLLGLAIVAGAGLALLLNALSEGDARAVTAGMAAGEVEGPVPSPPDAYVAELRPEPEAGSVLLPLRGRLQAELDRPAGSAPAGTEMTPQRPSLGVFGADAASPWPATGRPPASADCPDPANCPHAAEPGTPHGCFDPKWCPDFLRCPHRAGIGRR